MDRSSSAASPEVSQLRTSRFSTRMEPGKLKRADKTSTVTPAKPTKAQRAEQAAFKEQQAHQLARVGRQVSLNTKSITALKTREADVLKKLSSIEKQLRPIREKIIQSAPTMLDPAIEEEFLTLEAKFKKLLKEHKEILRDKELLSTQKPTDFKSKLLRGRIQKFLKNSSEVDAITAKLDPTIKTLGAIVRATGSTRTKVLSSYWVAHMGQKINYDDVENTARRLMAASYKFVKPLIEEIGKKGVEEALKARDNNIFELISGELAECKKKDEPKKDEPKIVNYFLKIAEECLDKGDPRTAQSILHALRRYYYTSDSSITDKEIAKRMSMLPKKFFNLENQVFKAMGALQHKEMELRKEITAKAHASLEKAGSDRETWDSNVKHIKTMLDLFLIQINSNPTPDLLATYKDDILPRLEEYLAVLTELCRDPATPRWQLKQLIELKDALGQAYANIHNVEQELPISIEPTFTRADRHDIEQLFESLDKSLASLAKLNRPEEVDRFSAKMDKCNAKLDEIDGLLRTLPERSKDARELGARYEMTVWTRNNELVKFQLQLARTAFKGGDVTQARSMLAHVDNNLRLFHREIKRFVDEKGVYRGETDVDKFKNKIFQDLLVERTELANQIAGPDAPKASTDRVKAHPTLFDTTAMSMVFDKEPKAAADLLTLRVAAFFRDIDLTKYRDGLLDGTAVSVSEDDLAAYRKGFGLTRQIEATISSAVANQVLAGSSPKEKAKRMQYFMQVAQECYDNGNFFAAHAIATALMGDTIKNSFKDKQGNIAEKSTLFSKASPYLQPARDAKELLGKITMADGAFPDVLFDDIEGEKQLLDLFKQKYLDYVGEKRQAFPIPVFSSFMENLTSNAEDEIPALALNYSLLQLLLLQSNFTPYVRLNSREGERARVQPNPSYAAANKMTFDPTIDPKKVSAEKGWKTVGGLAQDASVARPKTFQPSEDERVAIKDRQAAAPVSKPKKPAVSESEKPAVSESEEATVRRPGETREDFIWKMEAAAQERAEAAAQERAEVLEARTRTVGKGEEATVSAADERIRAWEGMKTLRPEDPARTAWRLREGQAEDVSDNLVALHQDLFDPAKLAKVLDKNPANTADFLTLKIVSFFKDLDFTEFRDRLLDESSVRITPQAEESYNAAMDAAAMVQNNIADLVKNKVLSGKTEKERAKHMKYFMQVAEKCFANGNFFAADAILNILLSEQLVKNFSQSAREAAATLLIKTFNAEGALPTPEPKGIKRDRTEFVQDLQKQYRTYVHSNHDPLPIPIFSEFGKNLKSGAADSRDKRLAILQLLLFQSNFTPEVRMTKNTTYNHFQKDPEYATAHKTTLNPWLRRGVPGALGAAEPGDPELPAPHVPGAVVREPHVPRRGGHLVRRGG